MKVFISQPMKGKTKEKILEEREEVTIKLSDGRIKTFKATSVK